MKGNKHKTIAYIIGALLGLLIFLIALNLGLFNHRYSAYIVLSGSMEPEIKTGSISLVASQKYYKVGDVVSYAQNGDFKNPVTHRIVSFSYPTGHLNDPHFTVKGDANKTNDPADITQNNIIGKVIFSLPYAGYAANFSKEPKGFLILVVIPATIIVYEELKVIKREILARVKFSSPIPKLSIIIPLTGTLLIIIATTNSYFMDKVNSLGNVLGAATSWITKEAGSENPASLYFDPSSSSLPPNVNLKLMLDPKGYKIGFVRVEINFDKTKVNLATEVNTTNFLGNVILKTSMNDANNSGRIIIILGIKPEDVANASANNFEIANFDITEINGGAPTDIIIIDSGVQIVDLNTQVVPFISSKAIVNFVMPTMVGSI
ncbi:signal peptidase I [Candidatus Woesebacteria bacterium]|nr:signal peptidase I [Candidatus Woesebacteria bacterium]QQG47007.1 MAG: signal peptidase I [Candidatus Woesebacteria bacterium]